WLWHRRTRLRLRLFRRDAMGRRLCLALARRRRIVPIALGLRRPITSGALLIGALLVGTILVYSILCRPFLCRPRLVRPLLARSFLRSPRLRFLPRPFDVRRRLLLRVRHLLAGVAFLGR